MSLLMTNSAAWYKVNSLFRYFLAHFGSGVVPFYIVNEYPKSGGSWIGEMLSGALRIPFPRNRLPIFRESILHGHMMQSWNLHHVLLVWRDGRDVLISQYFHSLFENDKGNARLVARCRADLGFTDYKDIAGNLIAFMEYVYERKRYPRFSWAEFVEKWADSERCVHVRYEDVRQNPVWELRRIVSELAGKDINEIVAKSIVDNHSFEKMSGRKVGETNANSFMRKGIVGDWKNYFDRRARKRFNAYAGRALRVLGYEPDDTWINQ